MRTIEIEKLDDLPPPSFDCGREEQNRYFHEHAWRDQQERLSTTYLFTIHGIAAGFATVCMDSLPLSQRERGVAIRYRWVSALKLAQLGVDRRFQGSGVGREVLAIVAHLALELGELVGCRYVTLDAQPELEPWYAAQGFVRNALHQQQRVDEAVLHSRDPERTPVSMRYDLGAEA
jgi:GNAT superfamily N-acetyltransferase